MKKENNLITFVKGFIIGLGIIFPISASGLAVSMGLYERILNIINNLKKEIKKDLPFIISFGLGVIISALVSCLLINVTYKKFPIATLLFFEGLIIGGLPLIAKKLNKKYKVSNFLWMIVGILALLCISFLSGGNDVNLSLSVHGICGIFLAGLIAAGTMIIPGVSGSLILVIMGYYEPMLGVISNIVKFNNLGNNILITCIFIIGMILGLLIVAKLMNYFLNKYETKSYFTIVGFIIASIINVFLLICNYKFNIIESIIGIILLIVGYLISFKFLKEE